MPRSDLVDFNGKVTDACGGGQYIITTENGTNIRAQLCGQMKKNHIRVLPGDSVTVGVSPYDLTHGLITRRFK